MLLTGGRIYTLDAAGSVVDSLVREGRIVFAGSRQDMNLPPGDHAIDLGGRAVLPGLVDAHAHLMLLARSRLALDFAGARSEEAAARLPPASLAASTTPPAAES